MSTPPPPPPPFAHTCPTPTLLSQGAEALLYHTHFLLPSNPCVLKYRPPKPYRHPTLDARLTKHRILSEARTMVKLRREGLRVPGVLSVDCEGAGGGGWMIMEFVEGRTVKEVLQEVGRVRKRGEGGGLEGGVRGLMGKVGTVVGRMHELGVIHGDLTTSNLMLRPGEKKGGMVNGDAPKEHGEGKLRQELEGGEVVLIDFGLAAQVAQDEDRAVDLYVLERAFGSTHPEAEEEFKEVLRVYGESYRGAKVVLKRLEEVRMRGRKRSMLG